MNKYRGIIKNQVLSELTYREHFITNVFVMIVFYAVLYFLWKAIYAGSGGVLNGLTFGQTYVNMALTTGIVRCFSLGIEWEMCFEMQDGNIIVKLVKPTNYMSFVFSEYVGSSIMNLIAFLIPTFIIIGIIFPGQINIGVNVIAFIACFVMAMCCMFLLEFMIGVCTFYTQSVWGLSTILEIISGFFAGSEVPLAFFPTFLAVIADFLPFKAMYYGPVQILTNFEMGFSDYLKTLGVLFVWLIILFICAKGTFALMKKKIVVNGG